MFYQIDRNDLGLWGVLNGKFTFQLILKSSVVRGESVRSILCATFRAFRFCPRVNKPSLGIGACFSHAEKTRREIQHVFVVEMKHRHSSLPAISSTSLICLLWVCWSRKTRMQARVLKECFNISKCDGQPLSCRVLQGSLLRVAESNI